MCVAGGGGGGNYIVLSPEPLFLLSPHEQISLPNLASQKDQQKRERTISGPCPSWVTGTVSNAFQGTWPKCDCNLDIPSNAFLD